MPRLCSPALVFLLCMKCPLYMLISASSILARDFLPINLRRHSIEFTYVMQMRTAKLLVIFNVGAYALIVASTFLLSQGHRRVALVGWICSVFSVCVFAAPLSIMVPVTS